VQWLSRKKVPQGKAGCTYRGSSPQNWERKMLQDTTSCRRFENPEEKVIIMGGKKIGYSYQ
jgi:hypothetical protein